MTETIKKDKYQIILSTDGKCTLMFEADHSNEIVNTLNSLQPVYEKLVAMAKEGNTRQQFKQGGFPAKPAPAIVQGKVCPLCGSPLIEATTKTGKKMNKCSTQKWNAMTKQVEGCEFIEWIN